MIQDPEGNVIELVADDPSVLDPNSTETLARSIDQ
jgi:hypothetical protein